MSAADPAGSSVTPATASVAGAASEAAALALPALTNRWAVLRPVRPSDFEVLARAELETSLRHTFRFRGATPSPEAYVRASWAGVLAQFVVTTPHGSDPIGLVYAYKADFQHGHCYMSAASFRKTPDPRMFAAGCTFFDYLFACWNFRKLYMEVAEYNLAQFRSMVGYVFEQEGCLREHSWACGRYWDEHLLALWRERWSVCRRHIGRSFLPDLVDRGAGATERVSVDASAARG